MDGRDLVRSVRMIRAVGPAQGLRSVRSAWRAWRTDARALPRRGAERARVPGPALRAEPQPGGGMIHFARSSLRVRVAAGGAVFCGWDGAEPEPSYALAGACPEVDARAVLEPDTEGGWRVVSERVLVVVSRHGAVEVRTPGGAVLRRELPPRWWDRAGDEGADERTGRPEGCGVSRWVQRSEVAADGRFFGLGGRAHGPRLRDGAYRLWNTDPGGAFEPGDDPLSLTMPVQLVVADAGTHLVFHDNSWDGRVTLREGAEGAGSGHDRPGTCELRMDGGPLRYWVLAGSPARVLQVWTALTGAPALPPQWALGYQHARWGFGGEAEVRRVVAGYKERELPLSAVHLDIDHYDRHRVFTVDRQRYPDLPGLARELRADGVRLVSIVDPAVKAEPGDIVYEGGVVADAFVRDARGREVRGVVWPGESVYPDFTDARVRKWWGALYAERLAQGFAGVWHDMNEPASFAAFGERTLPRSARHALEGRGGDHREAHNVYGLAMARAGFEGLCELRPAERPFLFSRSGWAGLQRYGGSWSGDVATGWPGLRASLSLVLGLGLCGVPYSGPDIGGFSGVPCPELYLRWFQLGAYMPLFRTHSAIGAGRREPWEYGSEVLAHARTALRERQRLLPYFGTLGQLARLTGAPYVRPLWWSAARDRALRDCEDAFLLGDALLVAPVLAAGVTRRPVRLPRGRWYDTATGRAYDGPGQVWVEAPLSRIPVLARAGAVLPVAGADGGTELEVWAPVAGRGGSGLVVPDAGDGWQRPTVERFTSRRSGGRVVVERRDGGAVGYPVRVRGLEDGVGA
ncbi:glycosyl hydrolase [Streptomyces sp. SID8375]|uniref:Glycoside hydrolase family 31 protein n=1 Tax=Streptomyces nigrescens TaxID=1920 RepID=A0ABY7JF10_STRNI|nr:MULTISPECIES: glycoside hydrolase family 31 protein [Streptomyces]MCX5451323.1 glycoside hydrolase family 31 protein [Streptomyces libani]MYX08382.1 glycosyl hydrolase [Streptomyces sp. SID8375]WAU09869.1 glycoside hydrolase family 31 protein [Streptomyces nigrescens]WDT59843.1 glycoside hydrolase family 31 protein [Streptomyces sp. G7(2002)]